MGNVPAAGERAISCGVVVTNGSHILLGHATRTPRWDIPKGLLAPGETLAGAAVRELQEETGLRVHPAALVVLGTHAYLRTKDLALFAWRVADMPHADSLVCASMVERLGARPFPELDRFAVLPWDEALERVSPNMARVLTIAFARLSKLRADR